MKADFGPILLQSLDEPMTAMHAAKRAIRQPSGGWLRAVREALGISASAVAAKIGITRQSYSDLEARERKKTASLDSLEKAAAALDCDLIYFLLPRNEADQGFSGLAARSRPGARHLRAAEHSMLLERQEAKTAADGKNIGLAQQLYWLRQNLSLYELITVNVPKLKEAGASEALFAHLQQLALQAITVSLCKIFEEERHRELNSIHGVINVVPQLPLPDAQRQALERFGQRYGVAIPSESARAYLLAVLQSFNAAHRDELARLQQFRSRFVVHSEYGYKPESLPSFEEFEDLYVFARDFYALVANIFLDVGPALMSLHVGSGFNRLLKQMGILHPSPGFGAETDA